MTVERAPALQSAVYSRLTWLLAAEHPDDLGVPVFDHPAPPGTGVHLRLENFTILPTEAKNSEWAIHNFSVRVFEDPHAKHSGLQRVRVLQAKIKHNLAGWVPLGRSGEIRQQSVTAGVGEGDVPEGISRFSVTLYEEN
ncbi:MAG: hypothetical protein AAF415_02290 [Pseudomonadota bacterium]